MSNFYPSILTNLISGIPGFTVGLLLCTFWSYLISCFLLILLSIQVQTLTFLILFLLVLPQPGLQLSINYVTLNLLLICQVIFILIDYPDYGTLFSQLTSPHPPQQLNLKSLNSFGLTFLCISNQIIPVLFISSVHVQNANLLVLIFVYVAKLG